MPTRSPLRHAPRRQAGQHLIDTMLSELVWPVTLIVSAVFVTCIAIADWLAHLLDRNRGPWISTISAAVLIPAAIIATRRYYKSLDRLALGRRGELTVAQALEELRPLGYTPFHDLPGHRGNTDHIIVGPAGIFVIETKTRSKPEGRNAKIAYDGSTIRIENFPPDDAPIAQARAAAAEVADRLRRETALNPPVRPVVLFPGWYVNGGSGAAVWVLNEKSLRGWLEREPRAPLSTSDFALLTSRLDDWSRERPETAS